MTGVLVARASGGRTLAYGAAARALRRDAPRGQRAPLARARRGPPGRRQVRVRERAARTRREARQRDPGGTSSRGLGVPNPGTLPELVGWLRAHAAPEDVLVTNFAWDNLYFYTNLRQGFRMSPEAPVRETARALGLPELRVRPRRRAVADLAPRRPIRCPSIRSSACSANSKRAARSSKPVASFREVLWENRPELHWHRFPRVGYPFAPRRLGADGSRLSRRGRVSRRVAASAMHRTNPIANAAEPKRECGPASRRSLRPHAGRAGARGLRGDPPHRRRAAPDRASRRRTRRRSMPAPTRWRGTASRTPPSSWATTST